MAHEQLHEAIKMLAGVCDYAGTWDGSGYNKFDAFFGHQLAERPTITDAQAVKAYKMVQKYKGQLARMGFDWNSVPVPVITEESNPNTIDWKYDKYIVAFRFSYEIKDAIASIPGARYNGDKTWSVPANSYNHLKKVAEQYKFRWLTDTVVEVEDKPLRYIELEGDTFYITCEKNYEVNWEIKKLVGRRWDSDKLAWSVPFSSAAQVKEFGNSFGFVFEPSVLEKIEEYIVLMGKAIEASFAADADFFVDGLLGEPRPYQRAGAKFLVENEKCWLGDPTGLGKTFTTLMAIKHTNAFPLIVCPKSAKTVWSREAKRWLGYNFIQISGKPTDKQKDAIRRLRDTKVAKKPQISGSDYLILEGINESPVGPLFRNESVEVVKLKQTLGDYAQLAENPQGVIINYDILKDWVDVLSEMGFTAIIGDESHRLKNGKAQRTKAFKEVGRSCTYKWLLSATPILNRMIEWWAQIQILGVEKDFGGYKYFTTHFCNAYYDGYGYNTSGKDVDSDTNQRLAKEFNEIARSKGDYIRREVEEVASELPEVQRNMIYLDIDNRAEYNKAVSDIIDYIGEMAEKDTEYLTSIAHLSAEEQRHLVNEYRWSKEESARRAQFLVKLNALRQITSRGKMQSIIEWIDTFVENGEKLLVAGWYEDHIKQLAAHYGKGYITGSVSQKNRDKVIDSFQNDDNDLLCFINLRAGGESITLTGTKNNPCRHVAYFNFDWSPEVHTQVRGRIRRLGTTADRLFEYYLIGEETIDDENVAMLGDKELVTTASKTGSLTAVPEVKLVQRMKEYFLKQANKSETFGG